MTTPDSTGGSRSLRTAGVALLGVAAIALLIGLVTLTGGDGSDGGDGSNGVASDGPTSPGAEPDGAGAGTSPARPASPTVTEQPSPSPPPALITPLVPDPAPADVPAADGGGSDSAAKSAGTVRIYNNSTIRGLATRVSDDMRAAGWAIEEVGNYSGGIIPTTTVYYENDAQRSAAEVLADQFGMRTEPRFDGIRGATPGLIVIVTNDYSA
ncbi:MAG: LytR C-terminal domain-containing protein [Actinomycetota bacterium]|nr:LytR C-terminal domain-containing protein [Actinomycetota bacterium]